MLHVSLSPTENDAPISIDLIQIIKRMLWCLMLFGTECELIFRTPMMLGIWFYFQLLPLQHWNYIGDETVKPVCNDHLYNKMYHIYFIQ